jgi:hypothetical protein
MSDKQPPYTNQCWFNQVIKAVGKYIHCATIETIETKRYTHNGSRVTTCYHTKYNLLSTNIFGCKTHILPYGFNTQSRTFVHNKNQSAISCYMDDCIKNIASKFGMVALSLHKIYYPRVPVYSGLVALDIKLHDVSAHLSTLQLDANNSYIEGTRILVGMSIISDSIRYKNGGDSMTDEFEMLRRNNNPVRVVDLSHVNIGSFVQMAIKLYSTEFYEQEKVDDIVKLHVDPNFKNPPSLLFRKEGLDLYDYR